MEQFLPMLSDANWVTAIGMVISAFVTFFVTKSNNKTNLSISDRNQLSKDQFDFIAEVKTMMKEQKAEIEELRNELEEVQRTNIALTIENKELIMKVTALTNLLSDIESGKPEQTKED